MLVSPYVRTVRTASGATAVQIVYGSRGGSLSMQHVGSARDPQALAALKAVARQQAAGEGQLQFDVGPEPTGPGPLPVQSSRMSTLLDSLDSIYEWLFGRVPGADVVFRQLVLARIIEPTSKLDSLRVLDEVGAQPVASYATVKRRLPGYAEPAFTKALSRACADRVHLGPATLVLYDVTTLYFETDTADGFRESGFSKERRLEPQITVGLLTDQAGFPLAVQAFEGNAAETTTMVPVIRSFMAAYKLPTVTVVADAGMVSTANQQALEAAGLHYILGARVPQLPYEIAQWRRGHPGEPIPDGMIFTQPWPAGPGGKRQDQMRYYQFKAERARRTLHGIDEQVRKAEDAVAGKTAVKRNRFVKLTGATKTVNRDLEAKARDLAGIKGYVTNLKATPTGEPITAAFVIEAYHRLFTIEKSFRMSKHDLQARPIYHHKRQSIEAHLNIVFAALAVSHALEQRLPEWSIRRFVRTARRYRTYTIQAGKQTFEAADPLPADLQIALDALSRRPH